MRRALLILLFTACGRSDVYQAPQRAALVPACVSTRGPSTLPRTSANAANPIEWPRGACLDVTYGPGIEPFLKDVQAALDQWTGPDCTWMCFSQPRAESSPPTGADRRRIHLRLADPGELSKGTVMLSEVTYDPRTGEQYSGQVILDPASLPTLSNWLGQLGQVLPFDRTDQDSVLNPALKRSTLSSIDQQSVCAVYPACP